MHGTAPKKWLRVDSAERLRPFYGESHVAGIVRPNLSRFARYPRPVNAYAGGAGIGLGYEASQDDQAEFFGASLHWVQLIVTNAPRQDLEQVGLFPAIGSDGNTYAIDAATIGNPTPFYDQQGPADVMNFVDGPAVDLKDGTWYQFYTFYAWVYPNPPNDFFLSGKTVQWGFSFQK